MTLIEEDIRNVLKSLIMEVDGDYAVFIPGAAYDQYLDKYAKKIFEAFNKYSL